MRAAGICLGASNISIVIIEQENNKINLIESFSTPHNGNVKEKLKYIFDTFKLYDFEHLATTGRKFRQFTNMSSISEPEAVEYAYKYTKEKYKNIDTIVSAGGESFMLYRLDKTGRICGVQTGNKCASGTGEFYLQQLKRMGLTPKDISHEDNIEPYKVSGRCSVFCKSDCTHALNKGESKQKVVAGLSAMMATKITELVKISPCNNILLIGGTSHNKTMVNFLRSEIDMLKVADEAAYFEALGTAVWALENKMNKINKDDIFADKKGSFSFLPSLDQFESKVVFKNMERGTATSGDECIIGLDVGSTTTKAVIMRVSDNSILASEYLRTNGDPVRAAKMCYQSLDSQISVPLKINGLGVTGSGRQIAGLHVLTNGVINEIIAHATAAVHFDHEVDTIFEIGGQDAKYTYITNGVASDYAMNEACSAGTGSFLEESAKESMGIEMTDIAEIAIKGANPPNFNDQCAAFIGSDIKTAVQEGLGTSDIVAGLVYSICRNYVNRVKGNRPVGKKVFMQGGVCYNKAVPLAMASLTGKEIIVPPEPGLMGAFGVALEVKHRILACLMNKQSFVLSELSQRPVIYGKPFICSGGKEKCDRKCNISIMEIKGRKYPFGGACNKYVNLLKNETYDSSKLDLVALREELVFHKYAVPYEKAVLFKTQKGLKDTNDTKNINVEIQPNEHVTTEQTIMGNSHTNNNTLSKTKIGIIKSLMVNTLYPLYFNFFSRLGFEVVLSDKPDDSGMERKGASFCYPVELSHGLLAELIKTDVDYIFLPQVRELCMEKGAKSSVTCPFAQGEPYYLKSTFDELKGERLLTPVLDFSENPEIVSKAFCQIGQQLGFSREESLMAYLYAQEKYSSCVSEMKSIGQRTIKELESDPSKKAVILFGRPYNAFSKEANMGIPQKFASRGSLIIPVDFLDVSSCEPEKYMYWTTGQIILKAAKYIVHHPQLYGVYITNFSCGPDSFVIGYFRDIMKEKPSLTLELDSHTADAGIDTRIEAFLDVVARYRQLNRNTYESIGYRGHLPNPTSKKTAQSQYIPAYTLMENDKFFVFDSKGEKYELSDKHVHVLLPSMGDIGSRCLAASFRFAGVRATCLKPPQEAELLTGRANSSCKECLPLLLTAGGLLNYLEQKAVQEELLVYFMPDTTGPCRFGQYNILIRNIIKKNKIEDVALISLSSANSYAGLGTAFQLRAWISVIISDVMDDIYSALLVLAKDKDEAIREYNKVVDEVVRAVEQESLSSLKTVLIKAASTLNEIPKKGNLEDIPKVALLGEIFVRRDHFSCQHIMQRLADKGIAIKTAPVSEWLYYCDYLQIKKLLHGKKKNSSRLKTYVTLPVKRSLEKAIKSILSKSGLYDFHMIDVDYIISKVEHLISPKLTGEAILTIGGALTEIIDEVSGVIAIGPFGCMPNRIAESIITKTLDKEKLSATHAPDLVEKIIKDYPSLPFLAVESDGNVFPQVVEARLEAFCLQVKRLNGAILEANAK